MSSQIGNVPTQNRIRRWQREWVLILIDSVWQVIKQELYTLSEGAEFSDTNVINHYTRIEFKLFLTIVYKPWKTMTFILSVNLFLIAECSMLSGMGSRNSSRDLMESFHADWSLLFYTFLTFCIVKGNWLSADNKYGCNHTNETSVA